jgi:DNA phosphorothioation-associated DGQHR protein 1
MTIQQLVFPYRTKALRVRQELAECYVAALPAHLLLDVCFSDRLTAEHTDDPEKPYILGGIQREHQEKRLLEIGRYIDRDDSAFPNSIILAANSRPIDNLTEDSPEGAEDEDVDGAAAPDGELDKDGGDRRWRIEIGEDGCHEIVIPTSDKLAAVVDGQHRLFGFTRAEVTERLEMDMICAIYLDLPKPFQAQIFATINSNQKRVDKSLTYEMFGYNIDDDDASFWTPDKLAVFLARRLGSDQNSPLKGKIIIAPKKDSELARLTQGQGWKVSTAVVVEGIARLITSNPKSDANDLQTPHKVRRTDIEKRRRDRSPLRQAYFEQQDLVIYTIVLNYLIACQEVFWKNAPADSFIFKTIGLQALFDILRRLAEDAYATKTISATHFEKILEPARLLDFSEDRFRNASGSGRGIIRRAIEERIGLR